MPGIDLSTLTAPELRQLLRLARARRDGLLIDRVEWEMAQRASLSSRVGFAVERKAPVVIEDGDVTIDEVRAFRRPEPGLPQRRGGGGRVAAGLGGLVAGSVLTAGAFAAAQQTGWQLPDRIAIRALPAIALADPPPARVERPRAVPTATSDAVAGALAPEPFPPAEQMEVAEVPPPPPPAAEPEPVAAPVEVAQVEPRPLAPPKAEPKPVVEKVSAPKPKAKGAVAKPKAKDAKPKAAKAGDGTKPKTELAKTAGKTKVAAAKGKDTKAKPTPKTKPDTRLAAKAKPTKVADARPPAKSAAKPAPKPATKAKATEVAKKDGKPAPKPPPKAKQVAVVDPIGGLIARAADGAAARDASARE